MSYRMSIALLPALLFALTLSLFQGQAQAGETALNTSTDNPTTATEPIEDPHRWGD